MNDPDTSIMPPTERVLFLDWDGVLNLTGTIGMHQPVTPEVLRNLEDICRPVSSRDSQACRIVLVTHWREHYPHEAAHMAAVRCGVPSALFRWDVADLYFTGDRAHDIDCWLRRRPQVGAWAVVDDVARHYDAWGPPNETPIWWCALRAPDSTTMSGGKWQAS